MAAPGRLSVVALALAVGAIVLIAGAGPGTRFGLWGFRPGLAMWLAGLIAGAAGAVAGLAALFTTGARLPSIAAVLLGAVAVVVPAAFIVKARSVPPIHDITTDTEDPPAFEAVLAARGGGSNPAEYAGAEIAAQQRRAYPDVKPLTLPQPADEVFRRAVEAARTLDWEIVSAEPGRGRIEATETTRWFGFKDDVVIRLRPDGAGTRIDVRSKSRVGRSDIGANAARIRRFLAELQAR